MANRYWVGGTSTWDATAGSKWATTSGGAGGAAVPTGADDVFFDANSGAAVVSFSSTRSCRSLNCTGFTGSFNNTGSQGFSIGTSTAGAGNIALKLVPGMSLTGNPIPFNFVSTSTTQQTIDTGGKTVGDFSIFAPSGSNSYILAGNVTTIGTFNPDRGVFNDGGYSITFYNFDTNSTNTRTITATGNWTCNNPSGGTAWASSTITNLTWSFSGTLTINTNTSTSSFNFGGLTIGALTISSTANVNITGSVSITNNFSVTYAPITITVTNGKTITVGGTISMTGSAGNLITLQSNSAGSAFTISKSSGTVNCYYLSLKNSTASGGATFNAINSTNVSGNSGWIFSTSNNSNFLAIL